MIVTAFNPETSDLERTFLSEYTAQGAAQITVKNNNGFGASQAILIGKMGSERAELAEADGITNEDVVTINGTTVFDHNAEDPVYKMRWNKIRFYRATSISGSYSLLGTVDIDVDNQDMVTRYDDTTGTVSHYYKVKYYNSISLEESDFSDPIQATGYAVQTAGKVIDAVVRRLRDEDYTILSTQEYLDIMNEVNDDLLLQSHRPYRFLKKTVSLNTTASTEYIDLDTAVTDFWKFDYLVYHWTVGGVTRKYKIDRPLSLEDFTRKYDSSNWLDNDELIDIALDEAENKLMLGPAPKTSQTGVVEFHYYKKFTAFDSLGDTVETPTTLVYRYKMMAEYYSAKAETDRQWMTLAEKYESKYGNEVVKMQRANRLDAGTERSFAPKRVPAYRKRYTL